MRHYIDTILYNKKSNGIIFDNVQIKVQSSLGPPPEY